MLRATPNALPYVRFGFVVSKRTAPLAVTRNRTRRRFREIVRALSFLGGWDVLLIARKGGVDASFASLQRAVETLARRLGLLATERRTAVIDG